MPNEPKTVIVTGASQGIGAALVKTFLERGYSVVEASPECAGLCHVSRFEGPLARPGAEPKGGQNQRRSLV